MKLQFLNLTDDERRLYFQQAALQRNASPVVMEKESLLPLTLVVLSMCQDCANVDELILV